MAKRKTAAKTPGDESKDIAYCRIYPGIGIARLGNSPAEPFIGPEVPGYSQVPGGGHKDAEGRIRKQAARFRLYGFAKDGSIDREVTSDEAEIEWTVQLANNKADWFEFLGTDAVSRVLSSLRDNRQPDVPRRNAEITDPNHREKLKIGPATARIIGKEQLGQELTGRFLKYKEEILLGQLRTDSSGRLIVTGGNGLSDTVLRKANNPLRNYANNDHWFDDIADGPVSVRVKIDGKEVQGEIMNR